MILSLTRPQISAAQVAFINPPFLQFKYTDVAAVANIGFIDRMIIKVVQSIMGGMAVLPNRFLVKLDSNADWFKTYQFPLGVLNITVDSGANLGESKKGKNFLKKLMHDEVDCYADASLGAETFRTKTIDNNRNPQWNETHGFLLSDHDQVVSVEVSNKDTATSDDALGKASVTVKDLLLSNGVVELPLALNDQPTDGRVRIRGQYMEFVADPASLSSQAEGTHGILSVLVASVHNIRGDRAALKPSVKVVWGNSNFRTAIKSDSPGADVQNPSYDVAYTVPLTASVTVSGAAPVRLSLMDGETEVGAVDVPLEQVLGAPDMFLAQDFQLQNGAVIRAAVVIRGTKAAH